MTSIVKYFLFILLFWQVACNSTESDRHTNLAQKENLLAPQSTVDQKGFFATKKGREMFYQYRSGTRSPVWLIIHGLGDDMTKIQALADKAAGEGFPVLTVDLQGHGETLNQYMKTHTQLPKELNYKNNIEDIEDLLSALQIQDLVIVGHSYGGAIAYGLAAGLVKNHFLKVHSVHLLAPYVQRIDQFLVDYYRSPEFLLHSAAGSLTGAGMDGSQVDTIMNPWLAWISFAASSARLAKAQIKRSLNLQAAQDQWMDPYLDQTMQQSYTRYFADALHKKESELTEEERKDIQLKVDAAILVTKGIRSFDLLDPSLPLPVFEAPLQVLGGEKDKLVLPAQLKAFHQRLENENKEHELQFIQGIESGHLFPRKMPVEVYEKIRQFQNQRDDSLRNSQGSAVQ